jgi:hypothetical protein
MKTLAKSAAALAVALVLLFAPLIPLTARSVLPPQAPGQSASYGSDSLDFLSVSQALGLAWDYPVGVVFSRQWYSYATGAFVIGAACLTWYRLLRRHRRPAAAVAV